jgi:hypothetical protein
LYTVYSTILNALLAWIMLVFDWLSMKIILHICNLRLANKKDLRPRRVRKVRSQPCKTLHALRTLRHIPETEQFLRQLRLNSYFLWFLMHPINTKNVILKFVCKYFWFVAFQSFLFQGYLSLPA